MAHDNLRDLIGQALSDKLAEMTASDDNDSDLGDGPDWCDSRNVDELADAIVAALAGDPIVVSEVKVEVCERATPCPNPACVAHLGVSCGAGHMRLNDCPHWRAELDTLRARCAAAEKGQRWRPIETAPRDLRPILLWLPPVGGWTAGPWRGSWSPHGECWVLHTPLMQGGKIVCLSENPDPTHWMPFAADPPEPAARRV